MLHTPQMAQTPQIFMHSPYGTPCLGGRGAAPLQPPSCRGEASSCKAKLLPFLGGSSASGDGGWRDVPSPPRAVPSQPDAADRLSDVVV